MWQIEFDSNVWRPWKSLGIARQASSKPGGLHNVGGTFTPAVFFTSEPIALGFLSEGIVVNSGSELAVVTTGVPTIAPPAPLQPPIEGASRIDVFGVGSDNALWHNRLDAKGWSGWTSVGGSFTCAPSIISRAAQGSVLAPPTNHFNVVVPNPDGTVHLLMTTDGMNWTSWNTGPAYRLPCYYVFSVDGMQVDNTMALHNDTDYGTVTLAVGRWPLLQKRFFQDGVNNGYYSINSVLGPVVVDLCEPVIFIYTITNSGNSDRSDALQTALLKTSEDYINDFLKAAANPATFSAGLVDTATGSMINAGNLLTDAGGGPIFLGSLAGAFAAVAIETALSAIFSDCDGPIANQQVCFQGRVLQSTIQTGGSGGKFSKRFEHDALAADLSALCNDVGAQYFVDWSITRK